MKSVLQKVIMFITGYFGIGSIILLLNQAVTGQTTLGLCSVGLLIFPIVIGIMIYGGRRFKGFNYDRFVVWSSLTFFLIFVCNIFLFNACNIFLYNIFGKCVMSSGVGIIVTNVFVIIASGYSYRRWVV